jgi:hypothetical protein
MTQEVKVTMTIEADVTKNKTDIEQSIRQKDFELISIDDIKEEREIYQSDEMAEITHNKLREILRSYGNQEWGDCIVDEISFLFGFPTTTDINPQDY